MKKTKILSLLLALAMLLSMAVVPASAAQFTDVPESYQYYEAIQSLVARGIINGYEEDNTFRPENTITRAEFCKMVIYAIGLEDLANTTVSSTGFPDVAANHWAAGAIKTAYDLKIINGFEDGTFRAEQNVTYDQAIKMVVSAKYDKFAEIALEDGGFPVGFRNIATKYGFLKNIVDGVYNDAAKRGTIAKLMDNMIGIKLSDITDDSSILESDQMEEIKGQVIAIPGATLDGTAAGKNQIKIRTASDGVLTFSTKKLSSSTNLLSLLGKRVVAYYEDSASADLQALSSISEQKGRNAEVVVDLKSFDFPVSGNTIYYENEDDDDEKVVVDSEAKIMYNGSRTDETLADLLNDNRENSGSIRFLFTSGDSGDAADVVFVTIYENYQVTSVTSSTKTIRVSDGSTVSSYVLDEEDSSKTISITKDGKAVSFSSITKDIIVSIAVDETGNIIQVLLGASPFNGTVTSITSGEASVTINGKTYEFSDNSIMDENIVAGSYVKVYLDAFGKIAKYEIQAASANYTYGYLTAIKDVSDTSMASDVRISVINLNSTTAKNSTYTLADNVNINGTNYKTSTSFATIKGLLVDQAAEYVVGEFGAPAGTVYQPIKYSLDSNKKVQNILIGKDGATDADLKVVVEENIKCTTNHTKLSNIYSLTSSTYVLFVPADDEAIENSSNYLIRKGNASGLMKDETYSLLRIDTTSSNSMPIVIVYKDMSGAEAITTGEWADIAPVFVVGRGNDGTAYISVRDMNNISTGEPTKVYDERMEFYNSVQKGDIIRYVADTANKKIDALELVVRASDIYGDDDETVFVKVGAHNTAGNYTAIGEEGGYAKMIREGETNHSSENATMSLMTGIVYKAAAVSNGFGVALDYDMLKEDGETVWTESALGEANLISFMTATSAKVVCVNMVGGAFDSMNEITYDELNSYVVDSSTTDIENADRVFVYRSGSNAKLIVVYRAK